MNKRTSIIVCLFGLIQLEIFGQPGDLGTERIPPSPTAASIAQYGAVPVNLATGTMSLDIPLCNLESTFLSAPVSLSYMANGIRTHQESGDVGLGWSLNAGGVISRTINGGPDDEQGIGYWEVDFDPNDLQVVQNAYLSGWDTEPDMFNYNFAGHAGKFIVDPEGEIKFYNDSKLKFEYLGINGWKATDLQGIEYEFQATDVTHTVTDGAGGGSATIAITSWYLTKITHPSRDEITFTYIDGPILPIPQPVQVSKFVSSGQQIQCGNPVCNTQPMQTGDPVDVTIYTSILTGISTRYYDLDIVYSNPGVRKDILNSKYVDYIEMKTKSAVLIKKVDFTYEYFNTDQRLKLKQLQESGPSESLPPYVFSYANGDLAQKYSYSVDHWGFQNDGYGGQPYLPYPQVPEDLAHFGNSRRQPSEKSLIGLLTEVKYPTGLSRSFTYELHDYGFLGDLGTPVQTVTPVSKFLNCPGSTGTCIEMVAVKIDAAYPTVMITGAGTCQFTPDCLQELDVLGPGGQSIGPPFPIIPAALPPAGMTVDLPPGLYRFVLTVPSPEKAWVRIEYVEVSDNTETFPNAGGARIKTITDSDGTRTFEYRHPTTSKSTGVLIDIPGYITPAFRTEMCDFGGGTFDCFECPGTQINSSSYNNMLSGAHVYYTHIKETRQDGSYNTYEFEFAPDDHIFYEIPYVPAGSHEQQRGQVKKVNSYDDQGKLVSEEENTYSTDLLDWIWAYRIAVPSPSCLNDIAVGSYTHNRYWKRLSSTTSKYYGSNGDQPLVTSTTYAYSADSYSISTQTVSSGSGSRTTEYKYAPDLIGIDPFASTMEAEHMIGIPLETNIDGGIGGGNKIAFTSIGGQILPHKTYWRLSGSNYLSGPEDLPGWKLHAKAWNFNSQGNPGFVKARSSKLAYQYTWDGVGLLTFRQDEQGIRKWDYDYNSARLLTQIIDNAGIVSDFTYDGLWRLETSETNGSRVHHLYDYEYGLIGGGENKITSIRSYPSGNTFGLPSMTEETVFDGFGRQVEMRKLAYTHSGNSFNSSKTYDPVGRLESDADPGKGGADIYVYNFNPLNEVKAFMPAATDVPITYMHMTNAAGDVPGYAAQTLRKTETTDQNGNKTEEYTDIFGRKIAVKKFANGQELLTMYTYNNRDQVLSIQPPEGQAYTFTYYDDGLLHTKSVPDKGTYTYTYTVEDQMETESLPNGSVLTYTFHSTQNSFLQSVTKGGQTVKTYTPYFADVRTDWVGTEQVAQLLGTSIGPLLATVFTYDDIGRVASKTQNYIDGSQSIYTPQYDNLDNLRVSNRTHTGPGGSFSINSTYNYDKGLRLERTTTDFPIVGSIEVNNLRYDDHDWLESNTIGGGLQKIDYGYEPNGWLASINNGSGGGSVMNENPCEEPEDPDPPVIDCVGPIVVTDYRVLYNCLNLLLRQQTMMRLVVETQIYAGTGYTEFEEEILIPLYGGIEEPTYTNEENITLNGTGPQSVDPVLQWILDFLEDCLEGNVPVPLIENVIAAALKNTNIQISSVLAGGEEPTGDLFYLNLHYGEGNAELEAAPQYNGNISWMDWQVTGESAQQYGFSYDGVDRLLRAKYLGVNQDDCFEDIPPGAYDVWGITYDKLGNIKTTQRNGMTNSDLMNPTFGQIDNMTYTYTGTSKLSGITDVSSSTKGFKAASSGYAHDAVGNLTGDSGKGLTAGYNFLDLPHTITTSTGSVTIVYDANGKKLKQTVVQGGTTEVWHYLDGIEFKNGARHAINHEEGRIVYNEPLPMPGGGNQNYREWFLKDHLGNTRVRFVDKDQDGLVDLNGTNPQVHEITGAYHYYPFGMELEGDFNRQQAHINRYKYNGKEWSDVSGWYEYGFRYYDPVIGRFTGVDPIAEKFPDISGFNYASNNPVANIDLHGLQGTSAVVNFKAGSPAGNLEALTKAITRSNEARLCPFKGKSIGGKIGLAIGMMMIHGDNPTRQQRQDSNDKALTRNLENGDFESFQQRISSWNKNNPNDRMVFRYLSSSELENASLNLEDGSSYLINLNRKGQFDEKYITPDLYIEGETAKKMLALPGPDSPDFAIWSYEDDILRTKEPPGTGVYSTVKADNGQPGGGKEAKIMQPFPIRGLFPIR